MLISQRDYDRQPLAVQQGALQLWGKLLGAYWVGNQWLQLYRFNDFLVQICYTAGQRQVTGIRTFAAQKIDSLLPGRGQSGNPAPIRRY